MDIDGDALGEVAGGLIDLGAAVAGDGNNRNNNGCGVAVALLVAAILIGLLIYYLKFH